LRIRKRYLLLALYPRDDPPHPAALSDAISTAIYMVAGVMGQSMAGLKVWRHPSSPGLYIASCRRTALPLVLLASALVTKIDERRVAIDVLKTSGTIDGLIYS